MSQITINLKPIEKKILLDLADSEQRDPRNLAGILVREALEHRGLLSSNKTKNNSINQEASDDRAIKS